MGEQMVSEPLAAAARRETSEIPNHSVAGEEASARRALELHAGGQQQAQLGAFGAGIAGIAVIDLVDQVPAGSDRVGKRIHGHLQG